MVISEDFVSYHYYLSKPKTYQILKSISKSIKSLCMIDQMSLYLLHFNTPSFILTHKCSCQDKKKKLISKKHFSRRSKSFSILIVLCFRFLLIAVLKKKIIIRNSSTLESTNYFCFSIAVKLTLFYTSNQLMRILENFHNIKMYSLRCI